MFYRHYDVLYDCRGYSGITCLTQMLTESQGLMILSIELYTVLGAYIRWFRVRRANTNGIRFTGFCDIACIHLDARLVRQMHTGRLLRHARQIEGPTVFREKCVE